MTSPHEDVVPEHRKCREREVRYGYVSGANIYEFVSAPGSFQMFKGSVSHHCLCWDFSNYCLSHAVDFALIYLAIMQSHSTLIMSLCFFLLLGKMICRNCNADW